jgi:hypothetical protein
MPFGEGEQLDEASSLTRPAAFLSRQAFSSMVLSPTEMRKPPSSRILTPWGSSVVFSEDSCFSPLVLYGAAPSPRLSRRKHATNKS